MSFKKRQDDTVGEDLAAVVVIRIGFGPQTGLIDSGAGWAVEHGNRRGVNKPAYPRVVGLLQQVSGAGDIDLFEFFPVAAPFVVVAKERRRMKHRIAALQRCCECLDVGHVTHHQLHPREVVELLFTFGS